MPPPAPPLTVWTARQRAALAAVLIPVAVALLCLALARPSHLADPQPPSGSRADELATRLDPNTADWPTLAALPVIGEHRAKDIVAYRERFASDNPGGPPAFATPADLMRVKGIGQATTRAIEPYLIFPPEPPADLLRDAPPPPRPR